MGWGTTTAQRGRGPAPSRPGAQRADVLGVHALRSSLFSTRNGGLGNGVQRAPAQSCPTQSGLPYDAAWLNVLRHTHWRSEQERRAFIRQHVIEDERRATGKDPDPETVLFKITYFETLVIGQDETDDTAARDETDDTAARKEAALQEQWNATLAHSPWMMIIVHTHWASPTERRSDIRKRIVEEERRTTGQDLDPETVLWKVAYLERLAVWKEATDRVAAAQAAEDKAIEDAILEEEKEATKADPQRRLGSDVRNYPLLNYHAAMGSVVAPLLPAFEFLVGFVPVLGSAIAIIEAINGETVFTGEDLGSGERALLLLAIAIPHASSLVRAGAAGAKAIFAIARQTGRGARAVLRSVRGIARASIKDAVAMRGAVTAAKAGKPLSTAERKAGQRLLRALDEGELAGVKGKGYGDNGSAGKGDSIIPSGVGTEPLRVRPKDITARPTGRPSARDAIAKGLPVRGVFPSSPLHHLIPQELLKDARIAKNLEEAGIDIDKYCVRISEGEHSAIHSMGYNEEWFRYFKTNRTRSGILDKINRMQSKYKMSGLKRERYVPSTQ